ncbi:hypothetical protein FKP32DRAFT_152255 [Trametes sanguinea]|nr:hypothetical protein FKP32DRAFT_152255 [Trametes sanguinea]
MFTRKACWAGCFLSVAAWQRAADFASAPMRVLSDVTGVLSTTLNGRLRTTPPRASLSASVKGDFVANCLSALPQSALRLRPFLALLSRTLPACDLA